MISIIIPVYNAKKEYLKSCLDSLLSQTYEDIEIVLVDDGSKQDFADFLDELPGFDERIRVFHQENAGPSKARNHGLMEARGEYVTFVDDDDWLDDDCLEKVVELAISTDADITLWNYDGVFPDHSDVLENKCAEGRVFEKEEMPLLQELIWCDTNGLEGIYLNALGAAVCKLYKTQWLVDSGIRFPEDIRNEEDRFFHTVLLSHCDKLASTNEVMYHYRQQDSSLARRFNRDLPESYKINRRRFADLLKSGVLPQGLQDRYNKNALRDIKMLLFLVYAHPDNAGVVGASELRALCQSVEYKQSIKALRIKDSIDKKGKVVTLLLKLHAYQTLINITKKRIANNAR